MSTGVELLCVECNAESGDEYDSCLYVPTGCDALQEAIDHRAAIEALSQTAWIETRIMGGGGGDVISFLVAHKGHTLRIIDEYGKWRDGSGNVVEGDIRALVDAELEEKVCDVLVLHAQDKAISLPLIRRALVESFNISPSDKALQFALAALVGKKHAVEFSDANLSLYLLSSYIRPI